MPEIEFFTPPVIKEILDQQRLILEMHLKIIEQPVRFLYQEQSPVVVMKEKDD